MRVIKFSVVSFALLACSVLNAQVWEASPTASSGAIASGTGQALYGGFGANASDGAAYNVYRKFAVVAPGTPLQSATNDPDNASAVIWSDIHQVGNDPGVIAPGMFMGTSSSTSSYDDQLIYLKPLIDQTGGGNGDSNSRRQWDMRFGFLEDVDAYISTQDPNSGGMDLWTGEWGTDGLSMQTLIGTNDTLDSDDWYTQTNGGLRVNAAVEVFDDERGRVPKDTVRTRYASGDAIEGLGQDFAGVAYDDAIELSWNLELNDPGNANDILGREVKFTLKVGNVRHEAIFDPGAPDDPVGPNDFFDEYSDGYFDWENATPVFFLGAGGGTVDGEGTMGVFVPGDFGANGAVDLDDFDRLAGSYNGTDTTYSRGDLTQDGFTNSADIEAWADLADASVKTAAIAAVNGDIGGSMYDFDGSGATDAADVTFVTDLFGVVAQTCGDFDMDGDVDAADRTIQTVGWTGAIGDGSGTATFADGDCDGDGDVDTADQTGLIGNWTGALGGMAGNLTDGTDADLVYDPATGNVTIDASDTTSGQIISFVIGTDQNDMNTEATEVPFIDVGTNTDNTPFQIGQTDPLNQGAGPLVDIGNVLPTGMDLTALSEYLTIAEYASELGAGGTLDLQVVPEPSGMALMLFGFVGFVSRRRK